MHRKVPAWFGGGERGKGSSTRVGDTSPRSLSCPGGDIPRSRSVSASCFFPACRSAWLRLELRLELRLKQALIRAEQAGASRSPARRLASRAGNPQGPSVPGPPDPATGRGGVPSGNTPPAVPGTPGIRQPRRYNGVGTGRSAAQPRRPMERPPAGAPTTRPSPASAHPGPPVAGQTKSPGDAASPGPDGAPSPQVAPRPAGPLQRAHHPQHQTGSSATLTYAGNARTQRDASHTRPGQRRRAGWRPSPALRISHYPGPPPVALQPERDQLGQRGAVGRTDPRSAVHPRVVVGSACPAI